MKHSLLHVSDSSKILTI